MPLLHRRTLPFWLACIAGCAERQQPLAQTIQATSTVHIALPVIQFDWDSAEVRPVDRAALGSFLEGQISPLRRPSVPSSRLVIYGNADRSGPDAYNLELSRRRAEEVVAELERLGLGRERMQVIALGERYPLVPTDDGVREPNNRAVYFSFGKPLRGI